MCKEIYVCMYKETCMCVCVYVCMCARRHALRMYVCLHVADMMSACMQADMRACMQADMRACMRTCCRMYAYIARGELSGKIWQLS